MKTGIALTAFTAKGHNLAGRLAAALGGRVRGREQPLAEWTREAFETCEALIFVGAVGIAVRAVAPYIRSKAQDPAVVCVDETGHWAVPILSGHLGGANELARTVAAVTGGEAVITTATDLNRAFAADLWAKRQGMAVLQPERIKQVSAKILCGEPVTVACDRPIRGEPPEHVRAVRTEDASAKSASEADVLVSYHRADTLALQLVPRVLTLGVGCRKGMSAKELETAFSRFCSERGIFPQAVEQAASIDLKQAEEGLLRFCSSLGWRVRFFSAAELSRAEGHFMASAFVESTTGVDNVCERAAVLASGGILAEPKFARDGVTFALAERPAEYDWGT